MSKIDIDKLKQMLADEEDRQIPLTKQNKTITTRTYTRRKTNRRKS